MVQEVVAALRSCDYGRLSQYIQQGDCTRDAPGGDGSELADGSQPLLQFADVLDVGSRRVLPGNLLRRYRTLSCLPMAPGSLLQRVSVTAAKGEEATLEFHMRQTPDGDWRVLSVKRDSAHDSTPPLPDAPHPRLSPEVVILSAASRLRQGDIQGAAAFFGVGINDQHDALQRSLLLRKSLLANGCLSKIQALQQVEVDDEQSALITSTQFQHTMVYPGSSTAPDSDAGFQLKWMLWLGSSGMWLISEVAVEP